VQKTILGLKTGSAAAAVAKTEMCGGWSKESKEIWLQIGLFVNYYGKLCMRN